MKAFLLFCCALVSLASKLCLKNGWSIHWELTGNTIKFTLVIDQETYDTSGYVGLGYQKLDETGSMAGADIDNIMIKDQKISDTYAESNSAPVLDSDSNGKNDISNVVINGLKYKWEKPLDSGDGDLDHVFIKDAEIRLLWAHGEVQDGMQVYHGMENRGVEKIVLSNDFTSGCDSSFLELI